MTSIAVIGGGISGLSTALEVRRLNPQIHLTVLEAKNRVGGVIETVAERGFSIEQSADNFITNTPEAIETCSQVGLESEMIQTNPIGRQSLVLNRGRLLPIPPGFIVMAPTKIWPLMTTKALSIVGKIRAACELFVPRRRQSGDESLQSFVVRRFGREMFDRLVQPLVGSIYTADPKLLSLAATMPRFSEMEQQHGSLIRAMLKQRNRKPPSSEGGARYSQFMTVRGGLDRLPQSIAKQLPTNSIRRNSPVIGLRMRAGGGWSLRVAGDNPTRLDVDGLIIATPGHTAADLLASIDPYLGQDLDSIQYASCAVVSLGYHKNQIGIPLNSFGFVVPRNEGRLILSCSFSSLKYPGRAPDDHVLLRIFIGGACQGGLLRLPREQLAELAEREVAELMKISGAPVMQHVKVHWNSMPQYHVGHNQLVARIEDRLSRLPTISLASSALYGVGIPSCIKSGRNAATQMIAKLAEQTDAFQIPRVQPRESQMSSY